MKKEARLQKLLSRFENEGQLSWEKEHPTPAFKREKWQSLCGEWKLFIKRKGKRDFVGEITVPYPPESRISGIERNLGDGERYVYEKTFTIPKNFDKEIVKLHFGAVDQIARVFVNGHFLGEHIGGYLPFEYDITDYLTNSENTLVVEVTDNTDINLPYGKQRKKRGGMWYTPVSGIWQSVWLENVNKGYIEKLKITPTLNSVTIETIGGKKEKKIILGEKEISFLGDKVVIDIEEPIVWSPDNPYLYYFTLTDGEDEVESYFALRTIDIKDGFIRLNEKPYFFHGVLDQGYFSDGIFTPKTPDGYIYDILTMKKLGFNMLRKHIKIEPEVFYYYCDRYGMIVFQDMVNLGKYNYLRDTVLPTIGFKWARDNKLTKKAKRAFENMLYEAAEQLYNHPSVCYWTIFNEGWGQYDADTLYEKMKKADPTRVWDATSGWFKKKKSDVRSEHVYFRKIKLKRKGERPLVLSEFGGYSYKIDEHSFNLDETYGYKKFTNEEDFTRAIEALYSEEIIPCIKNGLSAAVITQLSDVEDETNGFVTYDRECVKISERVMGEIKEKIDSAFNVALTNCKGV